MSGDWRPMVYDHEAIREQIITIRNGEPVTRVQYRKVPRVGELIARPDRKAYRVTAIEERDHANWHEQTIKVWEKAGSPDPATWAARERAMRLVPADDPAARSRGYGLYPWASNDQWWPLREQYPTCNDCGLIWPCPCDERTTEARAAMKELDRLGGIMPGCCWACNEPVTKQHNSIVFDGDNLLLPGGGPVVFHTAESRKAKKGGTCRGWAERYEHQWTEVDPRRPVRLRCTGFLYRHYTRSECTDGDRCPGVNATHADYAHCSTRVYDSQGVAAISPLSSCGGQGCRGPKAPVSVSADSDVA